MFWHMYMAHKCIDECAGCMYSREITKMGERILVCTSGKDPKTQFLNGVCNHLRKTCCSEFFWQECKECKTCQKNKKIKQ